MSKINLKYLIFQILRNFQYSRQQFLEQFQCEDVSSYSYVCTLANNIIVLRCFPIIIESLTIEGKQIVVFWVAHHRSHQCVVIFLYRPLPIRLSVNVITNLNEWFCFKFVSKQFFLVRALSPFVLSSNTRICFVFSKGIIRSGTWLVDHKRHISQKELGVSAVSRSVKVQGVLWVEANYLAL